jgi:hypothetical protein
VIHVAQLVVVVGVDLLEPDGEIHSLDGDADAHVGELALHEIERGRVVVVRHGDGEVEIRLSGIDEQLPGRIGIVGVDVREVGVSGLEFGDGASERLAVAVLRGDDRPGVDGPAERGAHPGIVERRLRGVVRQQEDVGAVGALEGERRVVLELSAQRGQERRVHVEVALLERAHRRTALGEEAEHHRVEARRLAPVVAVLDEREAVAPLPPFERVRAGADGRFGEVVGGALLADQAGGVREMPQQLRVRLGEGDGDGALVDPGHLGREPDILPGQRLPQRRDHVVGGQLVPRVEAHPLAQGEGVFAAVGADLRQSRGEYGHDLGHRARGDAHQALVHVVDEQLTGRHSRVAAHIEAGRFEDHADGDPLLPAGSVAPAQAQCDHDRAHDEHRPGGDERHEERTTRTVASSVGGGERLGQAGNSSDRACGRTAVRRAKTAGGAPLRASTVGDHAGALRQRRRSRQKHHGH